MTRDPSRVIATELRGIFRAAVHAADPARTVEEGLRAREVLLELGRHHAHWIVALGKAAPAMASAAVRHCERLNLQIAGGIVVGSTGAEPPHPAIQLRIGDHPVPGARSAEAAEALAEICERIGRDDVVILLISGGTSSLIGAPINGIAPMDLARLNALLLGAGVPIGRINAVRKRFARWGAGRLAAALSCERIIPILLADVPSEDPSMIGSGPVTADPLRAGHVEHILREAGIATRVPLAVASVLGAMRAGALPETAKPGSPIFAHVAEPFVTGNSAALEAAAAEARTLGYDPVLLARTILQGDATAAGRVIAHAVSRAEPGSCLLWGGETTVRLPADHGLGGRCQQLALAAAETLDDLQAEGCWILAAGTDGRDGPAPAGGALVNVSTWRRMVAEGAEPALALRRCDAWSALDQAGALLPPTFTGTNVMDVVVAVRA